MLAPTEAKPNNHRQASGWAFFQFETGAISPKVRLRDSTPTQVS